MNNLTTTKVQNGGGWLVIALDSEKVSLAQLEAISGDLNLKYLNYDWYVTNHKEAIPKSDFLGSVDLLKDYYEAPPKHLRSLIRNKRNEHDLNECPSCGYPFAPDTLDHFVPKDEWPEFSIFPNNLVPQCRGCAPIKSSKYFCNINNTAKFIHPIYSDILSKIGFKVIVEFNGIEPNFKISYTFEDPSPLSDADLERIKRHLDLLKVTSRFRGYCLREYRSWKNKIKYQKFDIEKVFLSFISTNSNSPDFHKNWSSAFYKGILENRQVLDYLYGLAPAVNTQVVINLQTFEI